MATKLGMVLTVGRVVKIKTSSLSLMFSLICLGAVSKHFSVTNLKKLHQMVLFMIFQLITWFNECERYMSCLGVFNEKTGYKMNFSSLSLFFKSLLLY